ncbi:hypothetical protein ACFWOB_13625 [Streptomyces sp. NPDC058420]|uniref:hypothetical protein n=1 Tax=Streptomyces sp. NPDC058420 TaxID=3346489 RepID=UPI003656C22F
MSLKVFQEKPADSVAAGLGRDLHPLDFGGVLIEETYPSAPDRLFAVVDLPAPSGPRNPVTCPAAR